MPHDHIPLVHSPSPLDTLSKIKQTTTQLNSVCSKKTKKTRANPRTKTKTKINNHPLYLALAVEDDSGFRKQRYGEVWDFWVRGISKEDIKTPKTCWICKCLMVSSTVFWSHKVLAFWLLLNWRARELLVEIIDIKMKSLRVRSMGDSGNLAAVGSFWKENTCCRPPILESDAFTNGTFKFSKGLVSTLPAYSSCFLRSSVFTLGH